MSAKREVWVNERDGAPVTVRLTREQADAELDSGESTARYVPAAEVEELRRERDAAQSEFARLMTERNEARAEAAKLREELRQARERYTKALVRSLLYVTDDAPIWHAMELCLGAAEAERIRALVLTPRKDPTK